VFQASSEALLSVKKGLGRNIFHNGKFYQFSLHHRIRIHQKPGSGHEFNELKRVGDLSRLLAVCVERPLAPDAAQIFNSGPVPGRLLAHRAQRVEGQVAGHPPERKG
jgi:hypothetical protein